MIQCIHCRMQFKAEQGTVILGQSEEQKLSALAERLGTHLRMAHQQHFMEIAMLQAEMAGFAVFSQFNQLPESATARRTLSAAAIQKCVNRVLLDEDIERIVLQESLKEPGVPFVTERVVSLLKQMRDWLQYSDVHKQAKGPELAKV